MVIFIIPEKMIRKIVDFNADAAKADLCKRGRADSKSILSYAGRIWEIFQKNTMIQG